VVPVLSSHSDTEFVMKGVTHGACDYLLKPVRIEELKNIWQHVIRRKKVDSKGENKSPNEDKGVHGTGDGGQEVTSTDNADQSKLSRKRKDQNEDEEEEEEDEENENENDDPSNQKKPRVVWSVELHRKFVAAVNQLGLESEYLLQRSDHLYLLLGSYHA
jgi:two-component response regulator (ARR-B family)